MLLVNANTPTNVKQTLTEFGDRSQVQTTVNLDESKPWHQGWSVGICMIVLRLARVGRDHKTQREGCETPHFIPTVRKTGGYASVLL